MKQTLSLFGQDLDQMLDCRSQYLMLEPCVSTPFPPMQFLIIAGIVVYSVNSSLKAGEGHLPH